MFTGIVSDIGTIERSGSTAAGLELRLRCQYRDLEAGESISLSGVCLTVRECGDGWFTAAAMTTTLERTTMSGWRAGTRVNLERAMRLSDRLGGHLVQGHVDGVAPVAQVERRGSALLIDFALPVDLAPLVVRHGSVTLDGVSLTVNDLRGSGIAQVSVIEYTERHTTLGALQAGDLVNVEVDAIGRYVRQLLQERSPVRRRDGEAE